jgi:PDZ domain-containing protein
MSRRGVTLFVVAGLILVLGIAAAYLPVPYVVLNPGPTTNTLGTIKIDGKATPVIQIDGHPTYDDGGHLNFTTVSYQGGPGHELDLLTALRGWLSSSSAVVPEESLFPKGQSVKQVETQNTVEMQGSQQSAIAAALTELKLPITQVAVVASVQSGMPAQGKLQAGDEITAVDGVTTAGPSAVTNAMKTKKPGATVTLTVNRGGTSQKVAVTTIASPSDKTRAILGITLGGKYSFPFKVTISAGDVGGPSAGLMFSLGLYDKLTPGSLTGGTFVAGTGEITAAGQVGAIGGIPQKMRAARDAGAKIFLTPPDNCKEALGAKPSGLTLVKAATMDSAVKSLEALRSGAAVSSLPKCS